MIVRRFAAIEEHLLDCLKGEIYLQVREQIREAVYDKGGDSMRAWIQKAIEDAIEVEVTVKKKGGKKKC
jgi:hypothetical protein